MLPAGGSFYSFLQFLLASSLFNPASVSHPLYVFTIPNATFTNQGLFDNFAEKDGPLRVYLIRAINAGVHYGESPIELPRGPMVHLLHSLCRGGVHNTEQAGCVGAGTSAPSWRSDVGVSVLNFRWKKQTTEPPTTPERGYGSAS